MAEHGGWTVVKGRGKDKNSRVRIYPRKRLIEFCTGHGWKPELVDIQFFLEPGITRNKSAAWMFLIALFLLEKAPNGGFELGSGIPFPIRRKKKSGIVYQALLAGTVTLVVDEDFPIAVFRQVLFFCRLQQRI